ncbi:MAG: VCBS repeat-containing protein [Rhodothermia bacterium]|nr:VCBS repeat-containing protein [Rhodothermia bacterium]
MKQVLSFLTGACLLLITMIVGQSVISQDAAAQFVIHSDFEEAWSLDPRDDATLFDHGPAFGARSVLTGLDVDNDGLKEILFSTDETLAPGGPDPGILDVFLYENNGDNNYEYVWHYSHEPSNSLPPIAYGDIDGDGNVEIYFGVPTINDDPEDLFIFEAESGVLPATPTVSIQPRADGTLDFRPSGLQLADVDGDGEIEIVMQSRTSGRRELVVMSLTGDKNAPDLNAFSTFEIEFEAGEAVLGGGGTYDVAVVDFDGDGANEIWYNTWDNWSMTIFEATGPDAYALQVDLNALFADGDPGSFNSHDMYFQDVDGDGNLEAWFPMTNGKLYYMDDVADVSTITAGNIAEVGTYDPTGSARGGDVGDVDGDGLWDIVASHGTSEKVSILEYDGVGNPADSTSYTWDILLDSSGGDQERYYPMRITDDLDGDGLNEVVLTNLFASNAGQPMIVVLELKPFRVHSDYQMAWSLDPRSDNVLFPRGPAFGARSVLAGMDLDNDGNKEILFTTDETLAPGGPDPGFLDVFLYENSGDDTYEYVWHYTHTDASNSLPPVAYGDIDSDGNPEIYFGIPTINDDPEDLFIFEAAGGVFPSEPTISLQPRVDGTLDFRPSGLQLADVDSDGEIEIVMQSRTSGRRELLVMSLTGDKGNPDLSSFSTFEIEFDVGEAVLGGGGTYDVMVVDFDGDGANEIWYNTWDNWSMSIFEATGPDTYALQVDLNGVIPDSDPGSFNSHDMFFQDIDNDGRMEAWFPMTNGKLYFVDDVSDVSTLTVNSIAEVGTYDATARARGGDVGDLDGDGMWDIVASHGTSEKVSLIEYDGVGNPADSTSYSWDIILSSTGGFGERYYPMRIADDLDGDGTNELVLTNLFASNPGQPLVMVIEFVGGPVAIEDEPSELPDNYVLHQNYPNPFNPTTTIQFELPTASSVSVRVYNVMGQMVKTLVSNEMKESGAHSVVWDGRDQGGLKVASGTYIYSLEYGNTRKAKSMVLLK